MSFEEEMLEVEEHFEKSLDTLKRDFQRIRTGRATPSMIDHVTVDAYGSSMRIQELAGVSVPEPSQLVIKPWDKGTLKDIEKGLIAAELGMAPQNDGEVIRLNVPPLSEERRKQLATEAKELCEKCKISMRNSRREAIRAIEASGKENHLPEDDVKRATEEVTETLKQHEGKAETMLKEKVDDIMSIG